MTGVLLLAAVLAGSAQPGLASGDTIVAARQGDVLVVEGLEGDLHVRGWSGDGVSVEREGRDEAGVTLRRSGNRIVIRPDDRRGRRQVDLNVFVPVGVGLEVGGIALDVEVEGLVGGITVRNVDGDVDIGDVRGTVEVFTVEGEVRVQTVRGNVRVDAQSDEVWLADVVGDVRVTTGSGDVELRNITARHVYAETTSGEMSFHGSLQEGGRYELSTHSGDLDVFIPDGTNAEVSVSTFDGEFESDFPVRLQSLRSGGSFAFTMGRGGATLALKAFDGEIRLLRAGEGR